LNPEESPGFSADLSFAVKFGDRAIGHAGLLDPKYTALYDVELPVWGAILEVDQLARIAAVPKMFTPVARFPRAERDCAFIVDDTVKAGELVAVMREAAGDIVEKIEIFDIYTGKPIPENRKSVAISLVYRAPDRTLGDDEVNAAQENAISAVKKQFNAELRDR
jgi:phenylalanyl-tRNA synthetase beta chain